MFTVNMTDRKMNEIVFDKADRHEKKPSPLTFARFAAVNRHRSESPKGFNSPLGAWSLSDWMTATLGELGEAANVVKKLNRHRDGMPGNKLSKKT